MHGVRGAKRFADAGVLRPSRFCSLQDIGHDHREYDSISEEKSVRDNFAFQ
jgi:hypothetical protein